jgi:hypothetical protein
MSVLISGILLLMLLNSLLVNYLKKRRESLESFS